MDWIACQITSNPYIDPLAIPLSRIHFEAGGLKHRSYVRPGKIFTANESLIAVDVGSVNLTVLARVRAAIVAVIQGTLP